MVLFCIHDSLLEDVLWSHSERRNECSVLLIAFKCFIFFLNKERNSTRYLKLSKGKQDFTGSKCFIFLTYSVQNFAFLQKRVMWGLWSLWFILRLMYIIISSNVKWRSVVLREIVFKCLKYTFWEGVTWGKDN